MICIFYDNFTRACVILEISEMQALKQSGFPSPSQTLQKWRSGSVPNTQSIIQLANGLNVSCDFLLLGKEHFLDDDYPDIDYQIIFKIKQLSDFNKARLLERIDTMLEMDDETSPLPLTPLK